MAMHALWPLLAQARPLEAPILVAVCTVAGITHYVELPAGKPPAKDHSATQHCGLCTFGADRAFAPPPAAFAALIAEFSPARLHAPAVTDGFASHCHPPAQPRAPPALS